MDEDALPITKPSLFLDLPTEIRLQIYAELWRTRNVRLASPNMKHVVTARKKIYLYGTMIGKPQALPLWLQTCTQMCREGLEWLRDNRDIIAEVDSQWWRQSTLFLHGLLIPLITTVMLGARPRAPSNRWCFHDSPPADVNNAFDSTVHPTTSAQICFADGQVKRTYYWKVEQAFSDFLEGLLERNAPLREIHLGGWYGRAANRIEMRTCTKPPPQDGHNEVEDMKELIRRVQFGKPYTTTLFNMQDWRVDVPEFSYCSGPEIPLNEAYDINRLIVFRWTRDLDM